MLARPEQNVVVNLLGVPLERPAGLLRARCCRACMELRARTGRPHWIVLDEAHHLLPAAWDQAPLGSLPQAPHGLLFVTVHPEQVAQPALQTIDTVVAVGQARGRRSLHSFAEAAGLAPAARGRAATSRPGEALLWQRARRGAAVPRSRR